MRLIKKYFRGQGRLILCLVVLMTLIATLAYSLQGLGVSRAVTVIHKQFFNNIGKEFCQSFENFSSKGPIEADVKTVPLFQELRDKLSPNLLSGGRFVPKSCKSVAKVAVIIPFRDRRIHLKLFLQHMHPFLQRQNLEYGIFVVEQAGTTPFNRAMMMNIGFAEALKLDDYDCFIFHDVDLLPLDDRNVYLCSDMPVHLSASLDQHGFKLMYENLFGGVTALTKDMMYKVNGFSNGYFGWGGEDDDMSYRVRSHGMVIERYEPAVARYTMLRHTKADGPDRTRQLAMGRDRVHADGLNSLRYQRKELQRLPLYTWLLVDVNQAEILGPLGLTI